MLVIGLIVGPAIGLLAGDFLFRTDNIGRPWSAIVFALLSIALLLAPFFDVGLRTGTVIGMLVGLLLVLTPMSYEPMSHEL